MVPIVALLALALSPRLAPGADPVTLDEVRAAARAVLADVVAARRDVHRHPELGERETRTAAKVAAHLRALGLEVRENVAHTGVVGVLRGGRPGPVIAYRADMDALPVAEQTGLPYASEATDEWNGEQVGVMHACGHDVHVAIAMGVASILAGVRERVPGTVVFLFQPAEEGHFEPGSHGAKLMLEEGAFEDPRPGAILGLHVNPAMRVGEVAAVRGGAMAAVDRFAIDVLGEQTHGAYPQEGVDPIVAASHVVVALQTIASRFVDTREAVVVSVGSFHAGNRFNIIPESARLVGTIRTHDARVQDAVHAHVKRIAESVARGLGAEARVRIDRVCPVTVNDPALVDALLPVLGECGVLVEHEAQMGGEDFAWFANEVPGLYYFLGVSAPDDDDPAMIHTPFFAPSEDALEVGLVASSRMLLAWLEERAD